MAKTINKITPDEEKFIHEWKKKWVKFLYDSGKKCTREEIQPYIKWRYKNVNLKDDQKIIISNSYIADKLAINFMKMFWHDSGHNKLVVDIDSLDKTWLKVADLVLPQLREQMSAAEFEKMRIHCYNNMKDHYIDETKKPHENGLEFVEQCFGLGFEFWVSFYQCFRELGKINDKKFNQYVDLYLKGVWSVQFFDDFVFVCTLPDHCERDDNKRIHCDNGPAIYWKTAPEYNFFGYNDLYFIHGIQFQKDYYNKLLNNEIPADEILKIQNTEVRTAAMSLKSSEHLLKELDAKLIDKYKPERRKSPLISDEVWKQLTFDWIELYIVDKEKVLLDEDVKLMRYHDTSTDRIYVDFVEPHMKTAEEAMHTCLGLTKKQYANMEVET